MLTGSVLIKLTILLLSIIYLGYLIYWNYQKKYKKNIQLKKNIALLREEKLLIIPGNNLRKRRYKLLKKIKLSEFSDNYSLLKKSKKLGLTAGELQLALKIKSNNN